MYTFLHIFVGFEPSAGGFLMVTAGVLEEYNGGRVTEGLISLLMALNEDILSTE